MKKDIQIHVTDRTGETHLITAPIDMNLNLMEVLRMNPNFEVEGECGGMALCATCHVYTTHANLNIPNNDELDMLDQAFFVQQNSRLGCQIYLTAQLDNLELTIAPK